MRDSRALLSWLSSANVAGWMIVDMLVMQIERLSEMERRISVFVFVFGG
jgi:hypothetical protein